MQFVHLINQSVSSDGIHSKELQNYWRVCVKKMNKALVQLQWFSAGMFWRERGQRMSATFTTNTTVTIATTLQRGFRKLGQRALSEHTLGLFMLHHPCPFTNTLGERDYDCIGEAPSGTPVQNLADLYT